MRNVMWVGGGITGIGNIPMLGVREKGTAKVAWDIFHNSEQGFVYDPNDLTTMFQNSAGTVPVTGAGQYVGLIMDKSGRNNHARQTTNASRPILRQNVVTGAYYLEFDGGNDSLMTNNISLTNKVSLFAGVHKLSDAAVGVILSRSGANASFEIYQPLTATSTQYVLSVTASTGMKSLTSSNYPAPHSSVLSAKIDIGLDLRSLSVNGNKVQNSAVDLGTGDFNGSPIHIGRRGGTTLPFRGHIYGLICISRLTSDDETAAIEKELAKRAGVTLSV